MPGMHQKRQERCGMQFLFACSGKPRQRLTQVGYQAVGRICWRRSEPFYIFTSFIGAER
jgi:hypothetical protein